MKTRLISLYIKYLLGRYSKDEFLEMRHLISETSDNELGNIMQDIWNDKNLLPSMPDKTKSRIKSNLDFYITNKNEKKTLYRRKWSVAAAIAVIFIISGSLIILLNQPAAENRYFTVNVDKGEKASIMLPDNSSVELNAATKLKYDMNDTKSRRVFLQGEAFFKVEKDVKRPFIVEMGDLQIEVLGTSFNVHTYEEDDYIQASLVEGSVKLSGKYLSKDYMLKPMEQVIYSKKSAALRIIPFDKDSELGWMDDRLVFHSETLANVIHRIERWYGVTIDLQCPEIKNDLMSGTFYNEDLKHVLDAIKIQYKVKYTIKENLVIISK